MRPARHCEHLSLSGEVEGRRGNLPDLCHSRFPLCHSRENGNPVMRRKTWIPDQVGNDKRTLRNDNPPRTITQNKPTKTAKNTLYKRKRWNEKTIYLHRNKRWSILRVNKAVTLGLNFLLVTQVHLCNELAPEALLHSRKRS